MMMTSEKSVIAVFTVRNNFQVMSSAASVHRKNDTIIVEALIKAVETILQSRVQSLGATRTTGIKHRVRFECARILCCVVCLTL
jgi:hypothetical protein